MWSGVASAFHVRIQISSFALQILVKQLADPSLFSYVPVVVRSCR